MPEPSTSAAKPTPLFIANKLAITISLVLLSAAVIAWLASYSLMQEMMQVSSSSSSMTTTAEMGAASIVSSLTLTSVGLFEAVWVIGMVAMMFPAMIPVVLLYNKVATKVESNPRLARFIGTSLFLLGYLTIYALLGLGAYFAVYGAINLSMAAPQVNFLAHLAPGLVLLFAGVYQLTPLKNQCLSRCVSPMGFFVSHGKRGLSGSVQMGLSHGYYCAGCCWLFMLVMLAVGAMSLPSMVILSAVIVLEKVIVKGSAWFTRAVAGGFALLGIFAIFSPTILNLV